MRRLGQRGTMFAASLNFFALGLLIAGLGPALPDLAAQTGASLAAVGAVVTGLFIGSVTTLSVAGLLSDRFGQRPLLFAGTLLMLAGLSGVLLSPSLPLLLAFSLLAGLGSGALDFCTNILVAEVFAERSTAALNLVNVFFGVGAVVGPFLASLALRAWGSALPALWFGLALLLPQLWLIPRLAGTARPARGAARPRALLGRLLRSPVLWLFGLIVLVYVGVENGLGSWTTVYLIRTTSLDTATAALASAGFWLALTAGRIVVSLAGGRWPAHAILVSVLVGTCLGGALLLLGVGSLPLTLAGVLLTGFCYGPIFPTTLSLVTLRFREGTGTAASVIVGLGSAGAATIPALQGLLLERVSPAASIALIAGGAAVMLLLYGLQTVAARRLPAQ